MDSSDRDVAVGTSGASIAAVAAVAVDAIVSVVAVGIVSDSKRELSLSPFGCLVGHGGGKAETEELVPCRCVRDCRCDYVYCDAYVVSTMLTRSRTDVALGGSIVVSKTN